VLAFSSLGRYDRPCLQTIADQRSLAIRRYGERDHGQIVAAARAVAARALAALGFTDGVFHMELFLGPDGRFVFSECAARRGGAMVEEEIRFKYGYSLAAAAVDVALGRPVAVHTAEHPGEVGTTYLHLPPGLVLDLPMRDDIMALPGVQFIRYDTHIGATITADTGSTDQRAAIALVSGADSVELEHNMAGLRTAFAAGSAVAPTTTVRAMRDYQAREWGRPDLSDRVYPVPAADAAGLAQ
jgi:hypothetical protein